MIRSVLTTVGSVHVGKKEGWFVSDLLGLLSSRDALLTFRGCF
jgi:hypothetical protein